VDVLIATPARLLDHFLSVQAAADRRQIMFVTKGLDRMLEWVSIPDIESGFSA